MARQDGYLRIRLADHPHVAGVFVHLPRSDLHTLDPRQAGERRESLEGIRGARGGRIDVNNNIETRPLADSLEEVHHVLRLTHPKTKPLMRRHQQYRLRTGVASHLGVLDRLRDALAANPRYNGHLGLQLIGHNARNLRTLSSVECEYLASVTVGYQPADSAMTGQPTGESAQFGLIDAQVRLERKLHRRKDASVRTIHVLAPWYATTSRCYMAMIADYNT